ncbi:hypothetical protein [Pseudonocardia humida]|uniref:Uncharacterized protein n=1 Tax=Pseudonocardia humida TaxID=2800819 RepID=A0ABT0ZTX7_9PSEU|nr:hypothetical protein [Pseudonocardia humida]MCO1654167.1 hypothetical protein [Pseudonocardia humida]
MTTGQIVAIVVLVLLVAIVVAAVMIFRRRSPSQRRLEAAQARREAEARTASAARLETEARERAERAKAEQAQAEELAAMARHDREVAREQQARAEELDPDHEFDTPQPDQQHPAVAGGPAPARELQPAATDARDGAHDDTRDDAPRPDERPRHHDYRRPEPIVGGAAAGMLKPRPAADDPTPTPTAPAPTTGPAAVPLQRSTPADEPAERRGTVGEFVRAKDRSATGATDPTARHDRDEAADPQATEQHQSPVRTFADRILGRS